MDSDSQPYSGWTGIARNEPCITRRNLPGMREREHCFLWQAVFLHRGTLFLSWPLLDGEPPLMERSRYSPRYAVLRPWMHSVPYYSLRGSARQMRCCISLAGSILTIALTTLILTSGDNPLTKGKQPSATHMQQHPLYTWLYCVSFPGMVVSHLSIRYEQEY